MKEFQIRKDNFSTTRIVETSPISLSDGDILLEVNNFSFTANNITYAVMGDQLRYWQFFPASGDDAEGWGIIPVWGFATVVESRCDDIALGERLFGYFPPANQVKITPVGITKGTLFDGAEHRSELPPGYNVYRRIAGEPNYQADMDNERMLLYPLYITAFSLHDMLQDNDWYGAEQVIIGSASSKTSIGLAYALADDESAPAVIGLTSQRNIESVKNLSIYHDAVSYDELESIDAAKPTVIVDMSANGEMLSRLHGHLGDNMRFCSNVGLTHWDEAKPGPNFIQERSEMFFAPGHIQKRMKDWGPEGFEQRSSTFIHSTSLRSREWLEMRSIDGLNGLLEIYPDVCHGRVAPEQGLIVGM